MKKMGITGLIILISLCSFSECYAAKKKKKSPPPPEDHSGGETSKSKSASKIYER